MPGSWARRTPHQKKNHCSQAAQKRRIFVKQKPAIRRISYYVLLFLIALLFASIFHFTISPVLTEETEFDVSCFHVIGKAMLDGKMPYLDFIDNKGPVQYIVFLFASLIGPFPWGIFLISTVLDFCMLVMLDQICRRLKIPHAFWILPLFLFFYVLVCSIGGLTEDMSLPLTMAAFLVYLGFDDLLRQGRLRFSAGFAMGLLFWLCAFTRINNALAIGLVTASMGVQLLLKKEFKKTAVFVASFAVSTVLVVLPVVLWLLRHGALQEFLNQFLLNNFKYSSAPGAMSKANIFFHHRFGYDLFLLLVLGVFGTVLYRLFGGGSRRPLFLTTLVALIGTALSFVSVTQPFPHYMLMMLIPAFFGYLLQFAPPETHEEKRGLKRAIVTVSTVLCCVAMVFAFSGKLKVESGLRYTKAVFTAVSNGTLFQKTAYAQEIDRIAAQIPEEERDSVFSIDVGPQFYAFSGITPAKRMFVCAPLFTGISQEYADEFNSYFTDDPPQWLLTEKPLETISMLGVGQRLAKDYTLVDDSNEQFHLYMRSVMNETH